MGHVGNFNCNTVLNLFQTYQVQQVQSFIYFFTLLGQSQQLQNQGLENPLASMTSALTMPSIFGDERDTVIAKLNQLQALWGEGKAVYSHSAAPITLTQENPFSRFKVSFIFFKKN